MNKLTLAHLGSALTALFVVAFLGLSGWYGGRTAWSDASAQSARRLVSQWREGKGPAYTETLWQQTHDAVQDALRLTPDNPHLLDDLGFLNAARALGLGNVAPGSPEKALQQQLLADAIDNYRSATALRPTFPYTWAYLALAKHLKDEDDAELWRAFDKAMQYGRYETGAQPAIAQVAFARWNTMSKERKTGAVAMVATAQPKSRQVLLDLAKRYGVALPR